MDAEPVKHVVESMFGKPAGEKRHGMRVDLQEHKEFESLAVEMEEDLNARDWDIGDKITLTVIGIQTRDGFTKGITII